MLDSRRRMSVALLVQPAQAGRAAEAPFVCGRLSYSRHINVEFVASPELAASQSELQVHAVEPLFARTMRLDKAEVCVTSPGSPSWPHWCRGRRTANADTSLATSRV